MSSNVVTEQVMPSIRENFDGEQVIWLIRLRWCAFAGLVLLIGSAQILFNISATWRYAWWLALVFVASNLIFSIGVRKKSELSKSIVAWVLIFDTLLLTVTLAVTGGAANPFSLIYLAIVSIAAFLLGARWTWIMVAVSSLCFSLLFKFHIAVPALSMHHGDGASAFTVHLFGMLFAFVSVSALLGYFLSRMSLMLGDQQDQILMLNKKAIEREKLVSLATLSAGAAHELATPLGTIAVAASELRRALMAITQDPEITEDVELIIGQVGRCRKIIDSMGTQTGELHGEHPSRVKLSEIVEELRKELTKGNIAGVEIIVVSDAVLSVPVRALVTALSTLVKNAKEACAIKGTVRLSANSKDGSAHFEIVDSGEGIRRENLSRIGEPFFTTKEPGKGMGLGVFLTKMLLQRINGSISIESTEGIGTTVIVSLPV